MIQDHLKALIKPSKIHTSYLSANLREAEIIIEPLERGFGMTLGTALRRVLLSYVQGAAVTSIRIDGILHEYSTIPGVREDVADIILNLKHLAVRMSSDVPKKIRIMASRSGPVLAQDIECPSGVEILDPEYVICTLGGDANLNIEMTIEKGCGYVPAHLHAHEDRPLGVLPIDAMFSPVRRVVSRVEPTRVGQRSDYDRLVLIVETNGSIKPDEAVSYAASVLQDQLSVLVGFMDLAASDQQVDHKATISFNPVLLGSVKDLELSVRSQNCLADLGIKRIGDLVVQTEDGLLGTPNFGRKSLNEIKEVLSQMGLGLCMDVPGWPPENIEDLSKTLLNW